MINLLKIFMEQELEFQTGPNEDVFLQDIIDANSIVEDKSEFVYVDGEEGDHGVVSYYLCQRQRILLAKHVIDGGDVESWEFFPEIFFLAEGAYQHIFRLRFAKRMLEANRRLWDLEDKK